MSRVYKCWCLGLGAEPVLVGAPGAGSARGAYWRRLRRDGIHVPYTKVRVRLVDTKEIDISARSGQTVTNDDRGR